MFVAPRFIAIDDKKHHLDAILSTFQELGAPSLGIHYDPAEELDKAKFKGVRGLFLDLHLIDGTATTDHRRHFANIANILEENISPDGGPFVLVIWSEHSHLGAELENYLNDKLDTARPHSRPLAVLSLAKEEFINVATGASKSAETLKAAIEGALTSNPQLAALIDWETDVLAAAGATLSAILALVPAADRVTSSFPAALDVILSRLARESVGKAHVAGDPRAAITAALAPILADRIVNQDVTAEATAIWNAAVTRHADRNLPAPDKAETGRINRMLHVAVPGSETILPSDWGGVSEPPADMWNDAALTDMLGLDIDTLLRDEFKVKRPDFARCRPRLVRIGAVCDHAQGNAGPIPFLVGLEIPVGLERILTKGELKLSAALWSTPTLTAPDGEAFELTVHCRFAITRTAAACAGWTAHYRLREQLLMHLISHTSVYASRPGIVRL